jgi:hypothetical protein
MATDKWPELVLEDWQDTLATVHMWTQIVGKTRLALAPTENHWWQVALYVTPRGLTTSAMPSGTRTFAVDFDFLDHHLYLRVCSSHSAVASSARRVRSTSSGGASTWLRRGSPGVARRHIQVARPTAPIT